MSATVTILDASSLAPTPDLASFEVVRVDYGPEAKATEHPVEIGVAVTDHVQVMPLRLTVEVFVTASPLGIPNPFAIDSAVGFLERALGKACSVVIDGEGSFTPYALESAPHSRTAVGGRSFALRFKQIRIASALSVVIPPRQPAPAAQVGAPTEAPLGQQATTPGTPTSTLAATGQAITSGVKALVGWVD